MFRAGRQINPPPKTNHTVMRYRDRRQAGKHLARLLREYAGRRDVIVLGLPRGGVPVAYEIAEALGAPLDILLVRKLGAPRQKELAIGAIASDGTRVLNENAAGWLGITGEQLESITREETRELQRRERLYRGERPAPALKGRIVILVDDGLATGSTMQAAVACVIRQNPARVVVAVPVAACSACDWFDDAQSGVVCVCGMKQEYFYAVGEWYEDFRQTTDQEVRELLDQAGR